jgi:antitoxin VapB
VTEERGEWEGKTFKSGNSVALRLPKGMGVPEGTAVRMVQEAPMSFRVEPLAAPRKKIDVSGFAGKAPWLKPLPRELREFEERPSAIARREAAEAAAKVQDKA